MSLQVNDLLHGMVRASASDLHVKAGSPPGYRIDGEVQPQSEHGVLTPEMTANLARQLMSNDQWERFQNEKDIDFSYALPDVARFRVNALHQRNAVGFVIRLIPDEIPDYEKLGLPDICLKLAAKPRGLVLVTGPTGSGKSTTLAAMLDYINQHESGHILTMEDPLEFVHPDKKCYVTQRQIGQDCSSFSEGLRRALRQDPDVILIGEMRDLETISMAITAAETGHLVFGTLHTTSAISTVDRIIDVFPTDAQQQVRVQLSSTLQGVISQTLVPKIGGGRVAAHEILVATDGVRSLIREGKTSQMLNLLQTGKAHGMSTLEDQLLRNYAEGRITADDAVARSNRPDDVRKRVESTPVKAPPPGAAVPSGMGMSPAGAGAGGGERGRRDLGDPSGGMADLAGAGPGGAGASGAPRRPAPATGGVQGLKMRRPAKRL